jgi:hypothetical protein
MEVAAREALERRIIAGEHIGAPEIRASRSRRSRRSSFQTVDGVHRGHVPTHQVSDCAVNQTLALERAHAGEHG